MFLNIKFISAQFLLVCICTSGKNVFRSLKYFLPQEAPFPGHYHGKPSFPVFYCLVSGLGGVP